MRIGRRTRVAASVLAVLGVAALSAVTLGAAFAAETTRPEYREAVEPICKANAEVNERILAGVRKEVRAGKLGPAASQFSKAARALKRTVDELEAVPPPPADRSRITDWLGKVAIEVSLFEQVAGKLRAGQKGQAQRLVVKLTTNANQANNLVIPLEFEYCRFEPARFT